MADQDERPRPAIEQVLELVQGVHIEVVGGLVEEQHVRLVHQDAQQHQPPPFAAGQLARGRPLGVPTQPEPVEQLAGGRRALGGAERAAHLGDRLPRGERRIQSSVVLPQVTQPHRLAADDLAGHRHFGGGHRRRTSHTGISRTSHTGHTRTAQQVGLAGQLPRPAGPAGCSCRCRSARSARPARLG